MLQDPISRRRIEVLDSLLDVKLGEFDKQYLSGLRNAIKQLEERWARIQLTLEESRGKLAGLPKPESGTHSTSSFAGPPTPTSSECRPTATDSSFTLSMELRGIDMAAAEREADLEEEQGEDDPSWTTVIPRHKKSQLPVTTEVCKTASSTTAVIASTPNKPLIVTVAAKKPSVASAPVRKSALVTPSAKSTAPSNTSNKGNYVQAPAIPGIENVVESRGHRLQILKNELRTKETPKLIDVDPDGEAVRRLDPRPCQCGEKSRGLTCTDD